MKIELKLNNNMRIKNMACLYHAITNVYDTNVYGDIPVDVFVSYDGNISISPSRSYGDVIDECILLVRDTDTFSLYTYDDAYDEVIYYEKNSFYELSLLEACGLILDVKDYFDYNIA